ncbi:MAG TPA: AAA family ATPase, partial [Gemmataceae bacterium]|nr:AAA family ATPase [Gemmataceae bacterium]
MSSEFEDDSAQEYRDLLRECKELFRSCAIEFTEQHPDLIHDSPEHFLQRMLDLHRGLVLKVFIEVAQADDRFSRRELALAREVFAHAWHVELSDEQVRESLLHYSETTHLRWDSLLWPFERLSAFRRRANDLFSLVQRMGLMVAEANRKVDPRALQQLRSMTCEMQRVIQPVPLAGDTTGTIARPVGRFAERKEGQSGIKQAIQCQQAQAICRSEASAGKESLEDVLAALDALIGLNTIKQDVRELVSFLKMQEERRKFDLPQTPISLHAVFTGNPGTGKTTVARLFGRILGSMGILAKGHLIETDRSGLVAEYAGQTAPKTNLRINEALDGVLFIDEAYSLVAESGDDPYGAEAVQTLLKRMEDDRDRLVVIIAGYPAPMDELLQSNPGLSSRFSRTFVFPDYTVTELGRVFATFAERDRYHLPAGTRAKLLLGFQYLLAGRDEHFGNGRLARNIFERSVRRLASRLSGVESLSKALLTTLQPDDIVVEGVPGAAWECLEDAERPFRLNCPGCQRACRLPLRLLGSKVRCQCGHEFEADWGEPGD